MTSLGRALRQIRKRQGLSLAEVGERMGLADHTQASRIERGNPRADSVERYLDALGATWWDVAAAAEDGCDQLDGVLRWLDRLRR